MDNFDAKYLAMLAAGFILAAGLYFVNSFIFVRDTPKNKIKTAIIFAISTVLAIASAFALNYLAYPTAHGLPFADIAGLAFNYLFCMGFLFLYSNILLRLARLDAQKHLNAAVPSIVLASAVCRIGCIFAGCCGGIVLNGVKVPTAGIECAVGFLLFFLFQFAVKTNRMTKYLLIYAPFRFIMEFLRAPTESIIFFNVLTPAQMFAIMIVIVTAAAIIIAKVSAQRDKFPVPATCDNIANMADNTETRDNSK